MQNNNNNKSTTLNSIKLSVFTVTISAALLPLSIYSFNSYRDTIKEVTLRVNGDLVQSNKASAKVVQTWIEDQESAYLALAKSSDMRNMEIVQGKKFMDNVNEDQKSVYSLMMIDTAGMQIARSSNDKLVSVADRKYVTEPMLNSKPYFQSAISKTTNRPILIFGAPIREDGQNVGVLSAVLDVDKVAEKITGDKIGKTGFSYLVDTSNNTILAHRDGKLVGKPWAHKDAKNVERQWTMQINGAKGVDRVFSQTVEDEKEIKAAETKIGVNLLLVSEIDASEIDDPISIVSRNSFLYIIFALFLSASMSALLAHNITEKFKAVARIKK